MGTPGAEGNTEFRGTHYLFDTLTNKQFMSMAPTDQLRLKANDGEGDDPDFIAAWDDEATRRGLTGQAPDAPVSGIAHTYDDPYYAASPEAEKARVNGWLSDNYADMERRLTGGARTYGDEDSSFPEYPAGW